MEINYFFCTCIGRVNIIEANSNEKGNKGKDYS
jgi:hypothetical protein